MKVASNLFFIGLIASKRLEVAFMKVLNCALADPIRVDTHPCAKLGSTAL